MSDRESLSQLPYGRACRSRVHQAAVFQMVRPSEKRIQLTNRFSLLEEPPPGIAACVHTNSPTLSPHLHPTPASNRSPSSPSRHLSPSSHSLSSSPSLLPQPSSRRIGSHSEINQLTHSSRQLIKLKGVVAGRAAVILLDCGATGNFISSQFVSRHRLRTSVQAQSNVITLADGSQQESVALVEAASVGIGSYSDTLDFVSLPLSGYDVILGMTWFHHYNPKIDWKSQKIEFVAQDMHRHVLEGLGEPSKSSQSASRRHIGDGKADSLHTIKGSIVDPSRHLLAHRSCSSSRSTDCHSPRSVNSSSSSSSSSSSMQSLFLISGKQLRSSHRSKELAFACLIFPQEIARASASSPISGGSINSISLAAESEEFAIARKKILVEYHDVFPDELPAGLPPSREVDHKIELVANSSPPSRPTFRMSASELV